jgi:hypothetical protein
LKRRAEHKEKHERSHHKQVEAELMEIKELLKICQDKRTLAKERVQELMAELVYLFWVLKSWSVSLRKQGAQEYFYDLVLKSMSLLLKKFVEEDICFASLIGLAILNKYHVDACVLGFSVWELKIVSDGFQFVSDR